MKKFLLLLLLFSPFVHAQQLTGVWTGAASSPVLWGGVRLNVSYTANSCVASGRLEFEGRPTGSQDTVLNVEGSHISFQMKWWDRQFVFKGIAEADRLRGTFTTEFNGQLVTGDWDLVRLNPDVSSGMRVPSPTGPYAVGRETFYWIDKHRKEKLKPAANQNRELLVYVWYPAAQVRQHTAYLPDLQALSKDFPADTIASMRRLTVDAEEDAPIRGNTLHFPVVIFSPGAREKTLFYSSLEMELASHGYVVAAIEHTYDVTIAFPGGRISRALPEKKPASSADAERQAMQDEADYRARDMLFVKTKLAELATSAGSRFSDKLDNQRVAVAGHSLGGMAALRACQLDPSIRACINIDGSYRARPFPSDVSLNLRQPTLWLRRPLYLFTDDQLKSLSMTRQQFNKEISLGQQFLRGGIDVQLPLVDINHMDFSDLRLLEAGISAEEHAARLLTMQMARDWVRNFVQKSLDGQPVRTSLIDEKSRYRDAHVSLYD